MGDGATQYVVQSFWTVAQQNLPIFFIIFKNQKYDIRESFSHCLVAPGVPGFDITAIDSVKLAEGYGCEGAYVSLPDHLEAAIAKGLKCIGPYVLQVDVIAAEPPLLRNIEPKTQYGA